MSVRDKRKEVIKNNILVQTSYMKKILNAINIQ